MKKIIAILVFSLVCIGSISANENVVLNNETEKLSIVTSDIINSELIELMKEGVITSLSITDYTEYDCTLTAEVSYMGAAVKLSITADDCEKAGAGLAQAVKGFMKEVNKK